ncbi:MAG TPA: zf-HC2 domain-containing protein [Bryobacteraceae bacterium]|nr:zf-HC2 domain-containing protein [Bryobacteraceae bacterium]
MNCDELEPYIADYLSGTLAGARREAFEAHLAGCEACRAEAGELRRIWQELGLVKEPAPSRALRGRFYASLEAYRHGLENARQPQRQGWWLALAAAMLLAGVAIGHFLTAGTSARRTELAELQGEVRNMRQMVTLALLQQQSPSDRLRGVDWGARVDSPDAQVLSALMQTLDHDPNVNVRLAAVDALRKFASAGPVRSALDRSLPRQESPLVQIALIDLLVGLGERGAEPSIRALTVSEAVNPAVKQRAEWGLRQLQ